MVSPEAASASMSRIVLAGKLPPRCSRGDDVRVRVERIAERGPVLHSAAFLSVPRRQSPSAGQIPLEGEPRRMRRYELMLVLRPDVADDRAQAVIDRTTRQISAGGGQIVKVAPWGRRRLAYPI